MDFISDKKALKLGGKEKIEKNPKIAKKYILPI